MGILTGYKIKSNLTEKQIEADVATYLGWISPSGRTPFRLLDIDEQITGADKKLDLVIPVYMQFKVSHGLRPLSIVLPITSSKYPLQKIRMERKKKQLADDPILYFKLRERAKYAEEFQHNLLSKLRSVTNGNAFYVAPLLLDKDEYTDALYQSSPRDLYSPFHFRNVNIFDTSWISQYGLLPFLRAHISIPPADSVNTAEHYYSYSSTGEDIVFHSPAILKGVHRLGDTFRRILLKAAGGPENWENINSYSQKIISALQLDNTSINDNNPLLSLREFGASLYEVAGIRQFLFLTNKELLLNSKM